MNWKNRYNNWMNSNYVSKEVKIKINNFTESELRDRFCDELTFGTGGVRGIMDYGTNRINEYTIELITQGYSDYLNSKSSEKKEVAIAYDTRNNSKYFAEIASKVFLGNNIKVKIFEEPTPTPLLSYVITKLGLDGGIVITASHNPKEYNGYKIYNGFGGQITEDKANKIREYIRKVTSFDYIKKVSSIDEKVSFIQEEVIEEYIKDVKSLIIDKEILNYAKDVRIIYSPLYGAGSKMVKRVLKECGFENVKAVLDEPDGDFPLVTYPNPEEKELYNLVWELSKENLSDVLILTDPDCDRVGIAVLCEDKYRYFTGNELGVLLVYYILERDCKLKEDMKKFIIKTIVTTDLVKEIAKGYKNTKVIETLTGFKYIGEKVEELEKNKECKFILGFEESLGYLRGNFVKDKDGVIGCISILEMILYYKEKGKNLIDVLQEVYNKYGYYKEELVYFNFETIAGKNNIKNIMTNFRENINLIKGKFQVKILEDYNTGERIYYDNNNIEKINLPYSNVLKFILEDNCSFVIRPSGTEPKLKIYFSVKGENLDDAKCKINQLKLKVVEVIKNMM
ncbi:phospho-sugar mutase [Hathewaya histolytica]|uniref:Phosphoglucomutase n=1 Tax=Hathewaya histolytica TaxID=1498 RepID=A0A4U9RLA9_HATHI|nr:phospho-sugar mutase [Hathewaya histolytica]VTQ92805.1 phosphomannomutase [Hathewaya histolytica]